MFGRLKKKLEPEKRRVTEEPEVMEVNEQSEAAKGTRPQAYTDPKEVEKPVLGIEEYSSALEIAEKIDRETAETKSALGEYLRQLDDKRAIAEKAKRLHDVVATLTNNRETKKSPNQVEINGIEIVLDATALNELTTIESVVKSIEQRLMVLQKAREALKILDQVGETEGIQYLALEREGIPEKILLKLS